MNELKDNYVYVSDAKVNMLYPKIPRSLLNKIAAKLGINLWLLNLNFEERRDHLLTEETARYQRLDIVTNYIKKNEPVGSIDNPKKYFEGTLAMHWARPDNSNVALFTGKTDQKSVLLAGSSYHLSGYHRKIEVDSDLQIDVVLLKALEEALKIPVTNDIIKYDNQLDYIIPRLMAGPELKVEFLARKLDNGQLASEGKVVYGTPVYVSLAGD